MLAMSANVKKEKRDHLAQPREARVPFQVQDRRTASGEAAIMVCGLWCNGEASGEFSGCMDDIFFEVPICKPHVEEYEKDEDKFFNRHRDEIIDYLRLMGETID